MQLTSRISLIELVFTIPAIIGAVYAFYRELDARRDVVIQEDADPQDKAKLALALNNARTARGVTFTLVLYFVAGALALFRINPPSIPIGSYILSGILILAEIVLVRVVILDHRARKRLLSGAENVERLRLRALSEHLKLQSEKTESLTAATENLTAVTEALTHEIANGPLAASKLNTAALNRVSDALDDQDAEGS
jgi:hypothetical protein